MKKILIITLTLILINVKVFAHKQDMHQHITREAFELLRMSFPVNFTGLDEMESYIGTNETSIPGAVSVVVGHGLVVSGVWIEDEYDIVEHYGIYEIPNYNNTPPWVEDLLFGDHDANRAAHTTITHFWDADNGEETSTYLTDTIYWGELQHTWEFTISENSIKKNRKYISGDYLEREIFPDGCYLANTYPPVMVMITDWQVPGIVNLYHGIGARILDSYLDVWGEWHDDLYYTVSIQETRKEWAYNRLGRMCHLLQDMSVPAHVHCTSHAGVNGMYSDYFENHEMGYHNNYHTWTAEEVFTEFGGFIDPYVHDDPIYFLMYFLNQMTDHYADGKVNGDDIYDTIPGLQSVISTLGVPTLTSEINDTNCKQMYDILVPYAIRATAGLMYWFAVETDQIDPLPEPVTVSGNVSLNGGSGNITNVQIKFDPQSSGSNNVYLSPDGNGNFSHTFSYDEFDTYDVTYSLNDYYPVLLENIQINENFPNIQLPDITLYPIISSNLVFVSADPQNHQAFHNIQDAVDYLQNNEGGTVVVAPGTYTGSGNKNISWCPLELHIKIKGLPTLTEQCIIDCEGSGVAFRFDQGFEGYNYTNEDIIESLVIKNANQGIVIENGSPLIRNNVIEYCDSNGSDENNCGIGICCRSSATIENNIIRNNVGSWHESYPGSFTKGGGIYIENNTDAPAIIRNNVIDNCKARNGGGVYCTGTGKIILDGNKITNNTVVVGGGGYPEDATGIYGEVCSDIEIINNILTNNIAWNDGIDVALEIYNSELVLIENNTIKDNDFQIGIKFGSLGSNSAIKNNIVCNNIGGIKKISGSVSTVTYCNVYGNQDNYDPDTLEGIGCISEPPELDPVTFQPRWEQSVKSPCIDTGDPASPFDPDGTPCDIGAVPAVTHKYDIVELNNWKWLSFPALDTVLDNADIAENVLADILDPNILEQVLTQYYVIEFTDPGWSHDYEQFYSTQGFKFHMNAAATFEVPGFKEPDNTTITLEGNSEENWIGYWLEETQTVQDAFGEYWNGSNIYYIQHQGWTAIKINGEWVFKYKTDTHQPNSDELPTLSYGDMVIVKCYTNMDFCWDNSTPEDPKTTFSEPQQFIYTEQEDYVPLFIELNPENMPQEIGALVNGECIGAVVVEDTLTQINAYTSSAQVGNIELELYYESRSENILISSYECVSFSRPNVVMKQLSSNINDDAYFISLREDSSLVPAPDKVCLSNYPNPFNPATNITYSLPKEGKVSLSIFNMKGQLVNKLMDGFQPEGHYSISWNGKDKNNKQVATGVYYYRLEACGKTINRKMILLK